MAQENQVCFLNLGYFRGAFSLTICSLRDTIYFEKLNLLVDPYLACDFFASNSENSLLSNQRNVFSVDVASTIRLFTKDFEFIIVPDDKKCIWFGVGLPDLKSKIYSASKFGFVPASTKIIAVSACGCAEPRVKTSTFCACPHSINSQVASWYLHRVREVSQHFFFLRRM
jgi:hypothetical protein